MTIEELIETLKAMQQVCGDSAQTNVADVSLVGEWSEDYQGYSYGRRKQRWGIAINKKATSGFDPHVHMRAES